MKDDQQINLSHEAVSRALETLFVEQDHDEAFHDLPAWQVHRHLADCEVCRRRYDGMALADRLLSSADASSDEQDVVDAPQGAFETSFAEASFMGALDQMLEEEKRAKEAKEAKEGTSSTDVVDLGAERSRRAQIFGRLGLAAAVLLAAAASWYAFENPQTNSGDHAIVADNDEFQPRSAATTDGAGPFEAPAIEIFCAERTADGVQFTGTKDAPFGLLTCPKSAELKLAYTNPSAQLRYAAFFGVGQNGNIYWYGPTPAMMGAMAAKESDQLVPFGESVRLEVNHQPGKVRVVGVFAAEPVDFPTLERLVDDADAETLFAGTLPEELDVRGVMTSSTFEVREGEVSDGDVSDGGQR